MRMDAYYYRFTPTGAESIDRILSAVACAGKAYHSTSQWNDEDDPIQPYEPSHRGVTPMQWIQNAAIDAEAALAEAQRENERLTGHDLDCRCDVLSGSHIDWAHHTLCSLRRECKDERDSHAIALAAHRQQVRALSKAVMTLFEDNGEGPWHDDDCPGDDTCECSWAHVNQAVTVAHNILTADEPSQEGT